MIIIGGSGSTGSSLLQNILNRHPEIFAGPETRLFIYPHLFKKWNRYKNFLLRAGPFRIRSRGWSIRGGADLLMEAYGWEEEELKKVIRKSLTFNGFVNAFFSKPLRKKGASVWIEKTPQNACSFQTFLEYFPEGIIIQTLRNPYDTMASLLARGFDAYTAAGYYVYHAAIATSAHEDPRYYQIRYEALVTDPSPTLKALMRFLGLTFDPGILIPKKEELNNPLKMKGWTHSERGHIESSSIGRFEKLPKTTQKEIIAALNVFKISDLHKKRNKIRYSTCRELCAENGYDYLETDPKPFLKKFRKNRRRDMLDRTIRLHPTHFLYYPGKL